MYYDLYETNKQHFTEYKRFPINPYKFFLKQLFICKIERYMYLENVCIKVNNWGRGGGYINEK